MVAALFENRDFGEISIKYTRPDLGCVQTRSTVLGTGSLYPTACIARLSLSDYTDRLTSSTLHSNGSFNSLGLGAHPTANGTFDPGESSKGGKSAIVRCGQWANVKMRFAPTPDENPAADCAH